MRGEGKGEERKGAGARARWSSAGGGAARRFSGSEGGGGVATRCAHMQCTFEYVADRAESVRFSGRFRGAKRCGGRRGGERNCRARRGRRVARAQAGKAGGVRAMRFYVDVEWIGGERVRSYTAEEWRRARGSVGGGEGGSGRGGEDTWREAETTFGRKGRLRGPEMEGGAHGVGGSLEDGSVLWPSCGSGRILALRKAKYRKCRMVWGAPFRSAFMVEVMGWHFAIV